MLRKNGTTILTPKLEQQQHSKVETHVASKLSIQTIKTMNWWQSIKSLNRGGQAVTGLVRRVSRTLKAHESTSLDAILGLKTKTLDRFK